MRLAIRASVHAAVRLWIFAAGSLEDRLPHAGDELNETVSVMSVEVV